MDKIIEIYGLATIIAVFITIGTPLYFFIRWFYHKRIENHPLKFSIDSSSVSAGGAKTASTVGITSIATSLKLIIHNRSPLKRQLIIDNLALTMRKEIEEIQINIAPPLNNRIYVNLNKLYEIDPKNIIILHIRITVIPYKASTLNELKENISKHLNEDLELRILFKIPPNIKKHSQSFKSATFFKELLGLVKSFN